MTSNKKHQNMNRRFTYLLTFGLLLFGGVATAQNPSGVIVGGNVFGGGNLAPVAGKTTVLVNQSGGEIQGDVYGGGALADVGTSATDSTVVNVFDGHIGGNVYGGGLGKLVPGEDTIAAKVYGKVFVNIGKMNGSTLEGAASFTVTDDINKGNVFGCNNICGTPLDSVFVNIYKTKHTESNAYPTSITTMEALFAAPNSNVNYAIKAVYGGGNMASYEPELNAGDTPKCATVHVWDCQENTIQTIYGGGNAADAGTAAKPADTRLIIDGGRFDRVFGGGNGYSASGNHILPYYDGSDCSNTVSDTRCPDYNPGANIFGTASTYVYGGLYRQIFGGSNQYGDIGTVALTIQKSCDYLMIQECFGGGNEADISSNVETTLLCTTTGEDYHIGNFYGGSNMASINGNVTLNVYGGKYTNVFGGSKGVRGDDPDHSISANISDNPATTDEVEGNVTLNLYGGTMVNAFGGSDAYGAISGLITVNLLASGDCGLQVDTIYGGGRDADYTPDLVDNRKVISPVVNLLNGTVGHVEGANTVPGCVFGGGKGTTAIVTAHPKVIIGDTITTGDDASNHINYQAIVLGNVFGGGNAAAVDGIDSVLMLKANSQVVNLFGGGNKAVADTAVVIMNVATTLDTIFGGGNLAGLTGSALVDVSAGTVRGGIYGGSNKEGEVQGDITVNVTGTTTIGATGTLANLHGGGYGAGTRTDGNVTVNFGDAPTTHSDAPKIFGDIYGGSALGWVNDAATDITVVNVVNGTVGGNIYGGGLGQQAEGNNPAIAALVKGKTYVNIGAIDDSDNITGEAIIGGSVYGCNNQNGSPQDSVFVNIFKTYHTTGETGDEATNTASTATYAIANVFGGGNKAAYEPTGNQQISVEVYNCDNTIEDVFGGGDAAAVKKTHLVVNGGRFDRVFAGGNGENAPANIGTGGTNLVVRAGKIRQLFGGSNMQGNIVGPMNVDLNWDNSSCVEEIDEFFGGSNEAVIGTASSPVNLNTTVACGVNTITDVYGGSNKAKIYGNVNLTINGGTIINAFGGSKGETNTNGVDAEISGNVQLNLFGGTVHHAFGGSNYKGNISGQVTVNVLDTVTTCPLALDTVYGGGNLAPYTPSSATLTSPAVNVIHGAVTKYVYGGGLGSSAVVTANPVVTVGYDAATMSTLVNGIVAPSYTLPTDPLATVGYDIYGGGDAANVNGTSTVRVQRCNTTAKYVYGGGNAADVTNTQVYVSGGVIDTIFGGGHGDNAPSHTVVANVTGNGAVTISGGTIGKVFAGCNLNGSINGNMNLNIAKSTDSGACDMYIGEAYGGGNMAAGKAATITIGCTGTIVDGADGHIANPGNIGTTLEGIGTVYGGANRANITNNIQLDINNGMINKVFGGNNNSGEISGTVQVNINKTGDCWYVGEVYGGGDHAPYSGTPNVNIMAGTVYRNVYGGGNDITADDPDNPTCGVAGSNVEMTGGNVLLGVYGGCNLKGTVTENSLVKIYGGTVGSSEQLGATTPFVAQVFGGGLGENTRVKGNVEVKVNKTGTDAPAIYGDVYGGSALGNVNTSGSNFTVVDILDGHLYSNPQTHSISGTSLSYTEYRGGNVYGGCLGQKAGVNGATSDISAKVFGKVTVNIGGPSRDLNPADDTNVGEAIIDGNVYGCNNTNGSPQDDVTVNVYRTHREETDQINYEPESGATYAIANVFGGGNEADYTATDKTATVHIFGCYNTVRRVFGGGNAAAAPNVHTNIEGGRFMEVFGGGNGERGAAYAANVTGNDVLEIHGGKVEEFYVGSNQYGSITGTSTVTVDQNSGCEEIDITEFFCGGKYADFVGNIEATITCSQGMHVDNLYGGCKEANVVDWPVGHVNHGTGGNVHLVVQGGTFGNIYGGSKGTLNEGADIEGSVLLEVVGGTVLNAIYGGSNVKGAIGGTITVNVEDGGNSGCPLDVSVADVYGGGNQADYEAPATAQDYPQVNIKNATVKNVYGGGLEAEVKGNPQIKIKKGSKIMGNVYGGGNMGEVDGSPKVIVNGEDDSENPHVFPTIP